MEISAVWLHGCMFDRIHFLIEHTFCIILWTDFWNGIHIYADLDDWRHQTWPEVDQCRSYSQRKPTEIRKAIHGYDPILLWWKAVKWPNKGEKTVAKNIKIWIGFWKCHSRFRLTEAFAKPFKPIFICLFAWSTISICAALLLIQMQMVEYQFFDDRFELEFFINLFSGYNNIAFILSDGCGVLSFLSNYYVTGNCIKCMWIWPPSLQCLRWNQSFVWSIVVVFVSRWYVENAADGLYYSQTTDQILCIWNHFMLPWRFQKGLLSKLW